MLCDGLVGWDGRGEVQEGGDACMCMADALHSAAETNTTSQSSYTQKKKKECIYV